MLRRHCQSQHRIVDLEDCRQHRRGIFRRYGPGVGTTFRGGKVAAIVQAHLAARRGFAQKPVFKQEAREQHPVPMLVGCRDDETRYRLSAIRSAPVAQCAGMRTQANAQRLVRGRKMFWRFGAGNAKPAHGVGCAGLRDRASPQDGPFEDLPQC